jgi:hypothetical protein
MSNRDITPQGRRSTRQDYEKTDANAKWIFAVVAFLFVAGLLMHFCLAGVMERFEKKPVPQDGWTGLRRTSQPASDNKAVPHLQLAPAEDLRQFRERERVELNSYGWINRTAGVVRIPIDPAMELVLQRGLPVRSGTNGDQFGPSSYELQQQRVPNNQPQIPGAK